MSSVPCTSCGADNPTDNRFCGRCGATLAELSATEERRWVTVLFADVSGFTALSEQMDPEDVGELARRCVAAFSAEVVRFGGTVVREFGDEVLAVFGAPVAHEDDAERAVRAALAIRDTAIPGPGGRSVAVHVGVNSGAAITTRVDLGDRQTGTLHGDAVNTAARLRSAAPPGTVWVGDQTQRATRRAVRYRELPALHARGKEQPVAAWEALGVTALPEARPLRSSPLVGRREELALCASIWSKAQRERRPHLITVLGDPGLGKSRLAAEFERSIEPGTLVLHGRCPPFGEAAGYWPLETALREAADVTASLPVAEARARMDALVSRVLVADGAEQSVPEIAGHVALIGGLDVEGGAARVDAPSLFASLRRFFEALSRERPVVLVIDDIHWADDALLELLEHLAARVRNAPFLVLTLARPGLLEERPSWGRGVRAFTTVSLEPLDAAESATLVSALAAQYGILGLEDAVGRGAGGNPLFVEELVAMLVERGATAEIPSAIKALISARIDALPRDERTTLLRASAFGRVFWESGVRALVGTSPTEALDALEHKDMLRAVPRSRFAGDQEYTFKHDLIRDVAYDLLVRADRRKLHGQIVAWVEGTAGGKQDDYLDLLTHHAVHADQPVQALQYLVQAAERAARAAAHRRVAAFLEQALAIADQHAPEASVDLRLRRAGALRRLALWAEAERELQRALELVGADDLARRAEIVAGLGAVVMWVHGHSEARGHSQEALRLADELGRHDIAVGAMYQLAMTEASVGELREGIRLFGAAAQRRQEHDVELRDAAPEGGVLHSIALHWAGQHEEAIERARRMVGETRTLHDTNATLIVLPHLGLGLAARGRFAEALATFEEARQFGTEYEIWPMLARALSMSAGMHLELGDLPGHQAIVQEARELGGFAPVLAFTGVDLLLAHARAGEVGRAEALMGEVSEQVERAAAWHLWLSRLRLATARAEIALARGDAAEAIAGADQAIEMARTIGRPKYQALSLHVRASALATTGRVNDAIATLDEALGLARPTGDVALLVRLLGARIEVAGSDELVAEAAKLLEQIDAQLPPGSLRDRFFETQAVRTIRQG